MKIITMMMKMIMICVYMYVLVCVCFLIIIYLIDLWQTEKKLTFIKKYLLVQVLALFVVIFFKYYFSNQPKIKSDISAWSWCVEGGGGDDDDDGDGGGGLWRRSVVVVWRVFRYLVYCFNNSKKVDNVNWFKFINFY